MQFPMNIGLHRSSFLGLALALTHALAVVAVLAPPWPAALKATLLAGIGVSAILAWRRRLQVVDRLRLLDDGRLECRLAGEEGFVEASLRGTATVHPWLTVVHLEIGGRRRAIVVLPDSMQTEDFRRLRVWLRWRAAFSETENAA